MSRYDVAIVGSGFAGSILARVLNQQGRRVLLLERGRHPRFALGESTTPLANLALERLARRYHLPDLHQLSTHGRWLEGLPHLRRGLKRGFTFFRHRRGERYRNGPRNEARLMVAASPDDYIADSHWLRADVDHHLVARAVEEGVDYRDETELETADFTADGIRLVATRQGRRTRFEADFLVDASGPGGFLARSLPIESRRDPARFASGLLHAHFEGVRPFSEIVDLEPGPYPDERAAVHHLLDFGWMYVLPFDHGTVSAGLILRRDAERPSAEAIRHDPARAWDELLARYPSLNQQFEAARPTTPISFIEPMQHRLAYAAGKRWFLLPHAYAFFDPLFSTGMAWSLLAVERLADLLTGSYGDGRAYGRLLHREADQIERLIDAAYRAMGDFERFTAVSFLYFATVSFAEARQRLLDPPRGAPPHAWSSFLSAADPERRELFEQARGRLRSAGDTESARTFSRWIRQRIEGFNVAGLADPRRENLYPVDLEILIDRAGLLGLSREAMRAALPRLRGRSRASGDYTLAPVPGDNP